MNIYEELIKRNIIVQTTNFNKIYDLINNKKAIFYIGFDPTADSLHIGHLVSLFLIKRLVKYGNKAIILLGGGTGMIGDPSGRNNLRDILTNDIIKYNCECLKKQFSKFIKISNKQLLILNNADWLLKLNYIDFLREIGVYFSVNNMLKSDCYAQRMKNGLNFLEFNYMLMQSYDFYVLYNKYKCNLQLGGNDQWSNMLSGIKLIHKKLKKNTYAMTISLLLNTNGKKMGKTSSNVIWLDQNKTSIFDFYQFWRNVNDNDVIKYLHMLTFLSLKQIDEINKFKSKYINKAKEILAYEMTKQIYGKQKAMETQNMAKFLFTHGKSKNMPISIINEIDLCNGNIDLISLLCKSGLTYNRTEARRIIIQGGIYVNNKRITDIKYLISGELLNKNGIILRCGKKKFKKIMLK